MWHAAVYDVTARFGCSHQGSAVRHRLSRCTNSVRAGRVAHNAGSVRPSPRVSADVNASNAFGDGGGEDATLYTEPRFLHLANVPRASSASAQDITGVIVHRDSLGALSSSSSSTKTRAFVRFAKHVLAPRSFDPLIGISLLRRGSAKKLVVLCFTSLILQDRVCDAVLRY